MGPEVLPEDVETRTASRPTAPQAESPFATNPDRTRLNLEIDRADSELSRYNKLLEGFMKPDDTWKTSAWFAMAGEFLRSGKPGEPMTPLTRLGGGLDKVAKLKFAADEEQAKRALGAAETGVRVAGAESRANIARHRKLELELAKLGRKEKGDLEKYILSNMEGYLEDPETGKEYTDAVAKLNAVLEDPDKPASLNPNSWFTGGSKGSGGTRD